MGTGCQLTLFAEDEIQADHASELAMAEVWRIESKYSRYSESSALSEINRAALHRHPIEIDAETGKLFDFAINAYEISGGLFDITSGVLRRVWDFSSSKFPNPEEIEHILPLVGLNKIIRAHSQLQFAISGMELDFGGIGKEYAVDRCADILRDMRIKSGLIDLGGDIRAIGSRPNGQPWLVGMKHPRNLDESLGNVQLVSAAIATSGDYERYIEADGKRYCHILNPNTGWPAEGLVSVSVMAEQCLLAGTLSTIAMLKGGSGKDWLKQIGVQHFWIDDCLQSGGNFFPGNLQQD